MNVRAWSVSLLLFLSTVTAVGQTVNRYLNTPLPKEWEESGEVFQQIRGEKRCVSKFGRSENI